MRRLGGGVWEEGVERRRKEALDAVPSSPPPRESCPRLPCPQQRVPDFVEDLIFPTFIEHLLYAKCWSYNRELKKKNLAFVEFAF